VGPAVDERVEGVRVAGAVGFDEAVGYVHVHGPFVNGDVESFERSI
jgi:hypothetical protein